MAKGIENVRKGALALPAKIAPFDPIAGKLTEASLAFDKKLADKGAFAESTAVKQSERRKAAEAEQADKIGQQRLTEDARLAEAESEIGRRRLASRQGGRRSLIGSARGGTADRFLGKRGKTDALVPR